MGPAMCLPRLVCLVCVLSAFSPSHAALNRDRKIADRLQTQLFALTDAVADLRQHAQRLDGWQLDLHHVELRLDALQTSVTSQLQQLQQDVQQSLQQQADAASQLAAVRNTSDVTEAALQQLRSQLGTLSGSLADGGAALGSQLETVSGQVVQLSSDQQSRHAQTNGVCSAVLRELSPTISGFHRDGEQRQATLLQTQAHLQTGLQQVHEQLQQQDGQLQQVQQQLQRQGDQLEQQLTATPAPTPDTKTEFLGMLLKGLRERSQKE